MSIYTLETLSENGTELSIAYDKLYGECFDVTGKLLPGKEAEDCLPRAYDLTETILDHLRDFAVGSENYNAWAQEGEEEDPPKAPNPPKTPENPPKKDPEKKEPETEDDDDWPVYRCLTCINRIDLEYMYAPFRAELN